MVLYDTTGRELPWVYRREYIDESDVFVDCLSINQLNHGDLLIINSPTGDKKMTVEIKTIIMQGNPPSHMNLPESSYYHLICKTNIL